ncbi:hypothetical protein BD414DRAFT_541171 [Trametes punicea]|nr:hypothetical protein BD414DRAFT_541171 [Trametes punicea]
MSTRFNRMEVALEGLAKLASDALQAASTTRQETKDGLDRLNAAIISVARSSRADAERVVKRLGNPTPTGQGDGTVFARIEQLERAVVELTESVSDPDAARRTSIRREASVNTSSGLLVDAGVDAPDLEPPIQRADLSIQTDSPLSSEVAVSAQPGGSDGQITTFRPLDGTATRPSRARFSLPPYDVQPLGPAQWTPRGNSSDESTAASNHELPSPGLCPLSEVQAANGPADMPSPSEGRVSSSFEEEEILNTLRADPDNTSQAASPPPSATTSPTAHPTQPTRPVLPLPRRSTLARGGESSMAQPPGGTEGPVPPRSSSPVQPSTSAGATSQSKQNPSPPLPRRMTVAAAASGLVHKPGARITVPLPRGHRQAVPHAVGVTTTSSSTLAPSRSGLSQPIITEQTATRGRSDSLSSLSSLSSRPLSQPPKQANSSGRKEARASERLRASSTSGSRSESVVTEVDGLSGTRDRSRSSTRGGRINANARVAKKERSTMVEPARTTKRRKTARDVVELEKERDAGSVSAWRGRLAGTSGRGRGRGGVPGLNARSHKSTGSGSWSKSKGRFVPPRIGTDCQWPEKIERDEAYQREFVQCDSCEGWYHFGCVGLRLGDPRLEPDAQFLCPPCESSEMIREQRQHLRFQEAACVRPDCDRAGLAEDTNEYFVERIIGRRPYDADLAAGVKRPSRFLWLVKWDGCVSLFLLCFKVSQRKGTCTDYDERRWKAESASWTEREHLGDCARLIHEFEQAAEIEGRDLSKLDHVIVLNEGAAVGW